MKSGSSSAQRPDYQNIMKPSNMVNCMVMKDSSLRMGTYILETFNSVRGTAMVLRHEQTERFTMASGQTARGTVMDKMTGQTVGCSEGNGEMIKFVDLK